MKPAALAALMPSMASRNTPSRSTHDVVRLLHAVQVHVEEEAPVRRELVQALLDEHAVGAEIDVPVALQDARAPARRSADTSSARRRRSTRSARRTRRPRPGTLRAASARVMVDSYSRMRPQPVQVRLQACSGSSISTSGNRLLIIGCGLRWRSARSCEAGCGTGSRRRPCGFDVLLPLRPRAQLVLEDVAGHAGRHRQAEIS